MPPQGRDNASSRARSLIPKTVLAAGQSIPANCPAAIFQAWCDVFRGWWWRQRPTQRFCCASDVSRVFWDVCERRRHCVCYKRVQKPNEPVSLKSAELLSFSYLLMPSSCHGDGRLPRGSVLSRNERRQIQSVYSDILGQFQHDWIIYVLSHY